MSIPKIAVIGGGVSGLAAAYYLTRSAKGARQDLDVSLFEAGPRLGGTIETEVSEGFVLEKGPDAFLTEKPWALALSKELGLSDEIIGTQNENRRSFIARGSRLLPVPEGFYLIAPVEIRPFLASPLVSWPGKIRMAAECFLPKKPAAGDESIAAFVRRRFGREALDRIAQAMLGGIYTGDPEILSLRATMPRFLDLEQRYGSVTRGLMSEAKKRRSAASAASGPRYSLFSSYRRGMQTLTDALVRALPEGCAKVSCAAKSIAYDPAQRSWSVEFEGGEKESFAAVCITVPAHIAARLLSGPYPALAERLSRIPYESVMTVNLGYKKKQIADPLAGFGFVVPRVENKSVIACSFSSRKFAGRAPAEHVLLRAFAGGAFGRQFFEKDDADALGSIGSELGAWLGITGKPVFSRLKRYRGAMVQYGVGHLDLVSEIRSLASKIPGLHLTGAAYAGAGIPDCVREAESEAKKIITSVTCPNEVAHD